MSTAIIIPARFNSQRFPGKPLAVIKGISLIQRVWQIANLVQGVDAVYIATDDDRIANHVRHFNAQVIMTETCRNGTERVFKAVQQCQRSFDIVLNLQGDAVRTSPTALQRLIDALKKDPQIQMATLAVRITQQAYAQLSAQKHAGVVGGTMVVLNPFTQNALYFSKSMIPFLRDAAATQPLPLYRHIGLYAYRYSALRTYVDLQPTPLEQLEGLEQLRALEHGLPMRVFILEQTHADQFASVDSPIDIQAVEKIIEQHGELI